MKQYRLDRPDLLPISPPRLVRAPFQRILRRCRLLIRQRVPFKLCTAAIAQRVVYRETLERFRFSSRGKLATLIPLSLVPLRVERYTFRLIFRFVCLRWKPFIA